MFDEINHLIKALIVLHTIISKPEQFSIFFIIGLVSLYNKMFS